MKSKSVREQILKSHGLAPSQSAVRKHRRLVEVTPYQDGITKTTHMRLIEQQHKKPIQTLLMQGSLTVVGKKLNISPSTASKWKKRLKLTYTKDNLPSCNNCPQHREACDLGICNILYDLELWDLVHIKQKELFIMQDRNLIHESTKFE